VPFDSRRRSPSREYTNARCIFSVIQPWPFLGWIVSGGSEVGLTPRRPWGEVSKAGLGFPFGDPPWEFPGPWSGSVGVGRSRPELAG
jgi:hypothetical protein